MSVDGHLLSPFMLVVYLTLWFLDYIDFLFGWSLKLGIIRILDFLVYIRLVRIYSWALIFKTVRFGPLSTIIQKSLYNVQVLSKTNVNTIDK